MYKYTDWQATHCHALFIFWNYLYSLLTLSDAKNPLDLGTKTRVGILMHKIQWIAASFPVKTSSRPVGEWRLIECGLAAKMVGCKQEEWRIPAILIKNIFCHQSELDCLKPPGLLVCHWLRTIFPILLRNRHMPCSSSSRVVNLNVHN